MANGLLAFISGLGTGYLKEEDDQEKKKRQDKLDQMAQEQHDLTMKTQQAQLDEVNRKNDNRKAVEAGLTIANSMKTGDLQDQDGNKYGTSTEDFTNRLVKGGINPEIAKGAAELYSKSAQQPGAEKWLSNTDFSDNATTRSAHDPAKTFERNQAYAIDSKDGYQTKLSPEDEAKFQEWVSANKIPFDNSPTSDYDMRGYWKDIASSGQDARQTNQNDGMPHFPDTYKTPYHKSFSNESRYATPDAPKWNEQDQLVDSAGNVVFDERNQQQPSPQMTGPLKGITQSDIDQKRADAYATGGIDYDEQRMKALHDSAKAKYGEGIRLLQKFDGTNFDDTVKKAYDNFDDGHDIHSEVGPDGKFYTYYTDPNGNKLGMKAWDSPDAFKYDAMMHLVDPNNADKYIENMMRFEGEKQKAAADATKLAQQERIAGMKEDRKDARDEARFAEQEKLQQRSFANMMAMLDKRLAKEGKGAKGLSDSDQQEDANIVSSRNKILGIKGGLPAIQDKLAPTITDNFGVQVRNPNYDPVIAEQYKAANKPRPAMVRIYGMDPMLDRFSRGLPAYKYTPLPPPDLRKVGETYEMPDGKVIKWTEQK